MGYKLYYQPVNAPTPSGTLPETRLPTHLTQSGGSCWIAYRKYTSWATHVVRLLRLPNDCPQASTCVVEVTLLPGEKVAVIACYLPQPMDSAPARLTFSLPEARVSAQLEEYPRPRVTQPLDRYEQF